MKRHKLYKQRKKYLKYALQISQAEQRIIDIFEKWLPDNIIDTHIHCNLPSHVRSIPDKTFHHMISTFPSYSIHESNDVNHILHPSKNIKSLRFAMPFFGIDHKKANRYLLSNSKSGDKVALLGLPEDEHYTISMLSHPDIAALKMYYSYTEPNAQEIYDIFKPNILEQAQSLSVPIILHVPKLITKSAKDILGVSKDFPKLTIVIAHLGSTKFTVANLDKTYRALAVRNNIFLDTALNPSYEVCSMAIKIFGYERILYGSDAPISLIRSVPYNHPTKGQQIVTSYPYHWIDQYDSIKYKNLADGAVHSHWSALFSLKKAIETLPKMNQKSAKNAIFHDNAQEMYGF